MTQIWLAVDSDGTECVYSEEPHRTNRPWCGEVWDGDCTQLPKGTIKSILRRKLTWEDEAVMVNDDYMTARAKQDEINYKYQNSSIGDPRNL